jgi:hypothetical protein
MTRRLGRLGGALAGFVCVAAPAIAGFASSETFLPAVGRVSGQGGAQFYTTVWATNLTSAPVSFTFDFLKQGQANTSPASFADTLSPGETKVYENIIESKFGIVSGIGAARIVANGEILVSERIYDQPPGADVGNTQGLFFAGVPKSFAISLGQSASIQGINQGGAENFRYNFALVETGGGSPTVNVQLFDGSGALLGQKAYVMQPYEQLQPNVADITAAVHTTNARITATITGGSGSVLLAGAQLANESQDSSGFEMSFRDQLLGGGTGVTSLNGLTGALTIAPGSGISITPSGNSITIAATGGGGGGSLTLPYSGSINDSGSAFQVTNGTGTAVHAIQGSAFSAPGGFGSPTPSALFAESGSGTAIYAASSGGSSVSEAAAVKAIGNGNAAAFLGATFSPLVPVAYFVNYGGGPALVAGNFGKTGSTVLQVGSSSDASPTANVENSGNGDGIDVTTQAGVGLNVAADPGTGLKISSTLGRAIDASSYVEHDGVIFAASNTGVTSWAVQGEYQNGTTSAPVNDGYLGGIDYGVYGNATNTGATYGVFGVSANFTGVWGDTPSTSAGVVGRNTASGFYGELGTPSYGEYSIGDTGATGVKHFVEPHPTDPTKEIRYASLEGPEAGTYFRGTGRIVNGFATIEVPDHFRMVTSEEGLTVVATPLGGSASLWVVRQGLDRIVIQGSNDVAFHYMVNGIRKAFADYQPISENKDFVPRWPTDTLSIKALPAESVRRLIANGILNADGSINLETAHRLGWDKRPGWNEITKTPAEK